MNGELFKRAIKFINENKRRKMWFRFGSVMAAIVVFVTTYALILPAITMENKTVCGLEEHSHMYDCYEHLNEGQSKILTCSDKLPEIHKHKDSCYDKDGNLICGYADYIIHEHTELCYDGDTLICTLNEKKPHQHTEDCYKTQTILVCDMEETDKKAEDDSVDNSVVSNSETSDIGENKLSDVSVEENVKKTSDTNEPSKHTHTSECYKTEKVLTCKEQAQIHTHDKSCYDGDKLICGKIEIYEHEHTADCFEMVDGTEKNVLICTKPEHMHSDDCYADKDKDSENEENNAVSEIKGEHSKEYTYEDSDISMNLTVDSDKEIPNDAELKVSDISEKSSKYQKFVSFVQKGNSSESDRLIAKSVTLEKDGVALDTSDYNMIAEVKVKETIIEPIRQQLEKLSDAAPEALVGIAINPLSESDGNVSETDGIIITNDNLDPTVKLAVNDGLLVLNARATANPSYSVQYYAYLPTLATSGDATLKVIDTSGKKLPKNNSTMTMKNIYLKKTDAQTSQNNGDKTNIFRVATKSTLTEIYTKENYEYIKAPNPSYVNKLIDNSSYSLKAIWVLKSGKSATSINQSDWNVYGTDIHFTNRAEIAANDIIYISDDTVIRFIYDCTNTSFTTPTTFYDYDITNGVKNSAGRWETGTAGINSEVNYSTSINGSTTWRSYRDTLAFGNTNTGTGMSYYLYDGGYLNQYNRTNANKDANTFGCTFELASRLENGKIVYDEWLSVPKLFNDGTAKGKRTYENSSMTFEKVGDTYTISSVTLNDNGTNRTLKNLQEFFNPSPYAGKVWDTIYTNNFWPMDKATNKTDPVFGARGNNLKWAGFNNSVTDGSFPAATGTFPDSDDGNAHNSYFGMQYAVSFTLTSDYTGPLEYLFYGDDDMWVFLDNTLVCDIGGVHSSVGEYVNLWDYIGHEKGDGKTHHHTLTLFYTERGASGSTCFMNFTLPSVTGINIDQKATSLRVEKKVVGEKDPTKEFSFDIRFYNSNGTEIKDDYAYTKYDSEGNKLTNDLIIHDGSSFTLKDGEYIIIDYLPFGTRYTVTETDTGGYTVSSKINEVVHSGNSAHGTIIKDVVNQVTFTNTIEKVGLTLQKLDILGTPLKGAVFELKDTDGNVINFVKNSDGSYTVPTESTQLFDTDQEYYIALNMDDSYVLTAGSSSETWNAHIAKKTGNANQKYKIYIQPDGSCSFYNLSAERWLDHSNGELANSTNVLHWENSSVPTSSDIQRWYFILNSDGSFKIKPRLAVINKNDAVLDMNTGTISEGQNVQLYKDNGTNAQKWKLVPVNPKSAVSTTTELEVGADGVLNLSGMYPGTYTLTETTAPYDYQKLDDPIKINVDKDGNVSIIEDNPMVSVDSDSGLVLKVKNVKSGKSLTIEKYVVGTDTTDSFNFTVSYTVDGSDPIRQNITLKNGESEILEIPYGAQVTVSEEQNKDFVVTYKSTMPITPNGNICTFTMSDNIVLKATNTAAGIVIPATGGNGTYMYTIAGAVIIFTALVLMYKSKKSRKENFGDLIS